MMQFIHPPSICRKCGATFVSISCPRCGLKEKILSKPAYTGRMNKTEARYAQRLEGLKASGSVSDYKFEAVKFRLADATFYTPDFMVMIRPGEIQFHEVKGGKIWDDSKVKFKVCADRFWMFGWRMVQWKDGVWTELRRYDPRREDGKISKTVSLQSEIFLPGKPCSVSASGPEGPGRALAEISAQGNQGVEDEC